MDMISPEMDSMAPKIPENMRHTSCIMNIIIIPKCMTSFGGHLRILSIKKVPKVARVATKLESF